MAIPSAGISELELIEFALTYILWTEKKPASKREQTAASVILPRVTGFAARGRSARVRAAMFLLPAAAQQPYAWN